MKLLPQDWLSSEIRKIKQSKNREPNYNVNDPKQYRQFRVEEFTFHPLALLIYEVGKSLQPFYRGIMVNETTEMIKLSNIVDNLSFMNVNMSSNKEKFSLLLSSDFSFYEKTLYEIQTASNFVKYGSSANFVNVSTEKGKRTPDLLVNSNIEVECKKKSLYPINRNNVNSWVTLMKQAWESMDNFQANYRIAVLTDNSLLPVTVKKVSSELQQIIEHKKEGIFCFSELGLTIDANLLLPYDKALERKDFKRESLPASFSTASELRQIVCDCKYSPKQKNLKTPRIKILDSWDSSWESYHLFQSLVILGMLPNNSVDTYLELCMLI